MNVGSLYVVRTTLSNPPKEKLVICISANEPLFFWLNTNPRREKPGQLALTARDHAALTQDCYLDCSRVTTFLPKELRHAQERDPISPKLAKKILALLKENPPKTLPPNTVALAINNLTPLAGLTGPSVGQ